MEKENKNQDSLTPRTFKNWLHNLSLQPFQRRRFRKILEEVGRFDSNETPAGRANSPLRPLNLEFARARDSILLLLDNSIDGHTALPIESFGTGIQQIFFILASIAFQNPKVIVLEEIELNLSPKYQFEFLEHIRHKLIDSPNSNVSQIFFTSHSPLLSFQNYFQIFQCEIDGQGKSHFVKANRDSILDSYPRQALAPLINQQEV